MYRDKSHNATAKHNCNGQPKPTLDAAIDGDEVTVFDPDAVAVEKNAYGFMRHAWITASVDDTVTREEMQ